MKSSIKNKAAIALILTAGILFQGCTAADIVKEDIAENKGRTAAASDVSEQTADGRQEEKGYLTEEGLDKAPKLKGLNCQGKIRLDYASCFDIYYYEDGCKLIRVYGDQRDSEDSAASDYLLVDRKSVV